MLSFRRTFQTAHMSSRCLFWCGPNPLRQNLFFGGMLRLEILAVLNLIWEGCRKQTFFFLFNTSALIRSFDKHFQQRKVGQHVPVLNGFSIHTRFPCVCSCYISRSEGQTRDIWTSDISRGFLSAQKTAMSCLIQSFWNHNSHTKRFRNVLISKTRKYPVIGWGPRRFSRPKQAQYV
jgi:hypothetical protein